MNALAAHQGLMPRAPGGTAPGAALSLLVHAALVAALAYGVSWRSPATEVVSAELWAAVPQVAAPPAPEPPPPAPVVAPPRPAPRTPAAPLPDPQIAIEQARREKAEQQRLERAERARQDALAREKEQRAARERELAEQRENAAAQALLARQREENLRRMMGQLGSAAAGTSGSAAADAAPSAAYGGRLVRAIKPNVVFTEAYTGNPAAEVEVRAAPNGTIIGRRLVKSSGHKAWDEAVLRAIDRTGTLPRDTDGRVPGTLTITFRPRD